MTTRDRLFGQATEAIRGYLGEYDPDDLAGELIEDLGEEVIDALIDATYQVEARVEEEMAE